MQDLVAGPNRSCDRRSGHSLPQIRAGNIKVYAYTGKSRLPTLPDVPTARRPACRVSTPRLERDLGAERHAEGNHRKPQRGGRGGARRSATRARLAELGHYAVPRESHSAEVLHALHKAEIEKWWPIIKAAHIRAD